MGSSSKSTITDTYLIEKLKEILVRLNLPSSKSNTVHIDTDDASASGQGPSNEVKHFPSLNYHRDNGHGVNVKSLYGLGEALEESESDVILKRNLNEFIQALKLSLNPTTSSTIGGGTASTSAVISAHNHHQQYDNAGGYGKSLSPADMMFPSMASNEYEFNLTDDDINNLNHFMSSEESGSMALKHIVIICVYICIAIIAIIGNFLVVELVIRSRRLHTLTHALLANLAVADLFMAGLNIPFSISRVILAEWPFGSFLCQLIPFVQVTSVYVTSITMASIALDRYQVIMNPLGRRMKSSEGALLVFIIWLLSGLLALPYALHHKVVSILTVRVVKRCQADFTSLESRQWLTVGTFMTQYLIPLSITSVSYVSIMHRLGKRTSGLGSTTPRQVEAQSRGKRTTIKMLVLTVIFFAVCFAPINIYHILTHFSIVRHNSTAILICHLIAMSSTCYNPFIYCWLNEHFRLEALKWLKCFRTKRSPTVHPGIEVNGILTRQDFYRRNLSANAGGGGAAAVGSMSVRSQAVVNSSNAAASSGENQGTASTSSRGRKARLTKSPGNAGAGNRSFSTRMPRGIFPPELLFLTRPSISNIPELSEGLDEEENVRDAGLPEQKPLRREEDDAFDEEEREETDDTQGNDAENQKTLQIIADNDE